MDKIQKNFFYLTHIDASRNSTYFRSPDFSHVIIIVAKHKKMEVVTRVLRESYQILHRLKPVYHFESMFRLFEGEDVIKTCECQEGCLSSNRLIFGCKQSNCCCNCVNDAHVDTAVIFWWHLNKKSCFILISISPFKLE